MLLGAGGLATGLLGDPGPGVVALPGVQGAPATVAEVPAGRSLLPAVAEVEPMPLLVEEVVLVEGVPALAVVEGIPVLLVVLVVEPLFDGVQGAVVEVVAGLPD